MSDNVVHMKLDGSSKSHSRTDIITRDVESVIDEPIARGGTNLGNIHRTCHKLCRERL